VIRAVIHPLSDQPLIVDVEELPAPGDVSLVCFNVRTLDGKKPKFVDRKDSTFAFPLNSIRFVEFYPSGEGGQVLEAQEAEPEELEIDEDFLRRVREA
jgi:hypothetical protein